MNELQVFNNAMFGNVRIILQDNEPWFVAKDVCDCLEINNSRQALSRLDSDEKNSVILNDGTQGNPEKSVVNEYGLYSLVLSSRKPEAKEFKRWITHEVLPSLRKYGTYSMNIPRTLPDALKAYANEIEAHNQTKMLLDEQKVLIAAQEQQISEFKPIRDYVDEILSSTSALTITQIAADYDITARALNKILEEEKIQRSVGGQWILYKNQMGKGYTKSETFTFTRSDGRLDSKITTKWTQKGRLMIHEIMKSRGIDAVCKDIA